MTEERQDKPAPEPQEHSMTRRLDRERLRELHSQGMTDADIARHLSADPKYVNRVRRGMNLPRNKRVSDEQTRRAKAMFDDGASYREVSRVLRIPATTLARLFPGAGHEPTQPIDRDLLRALHAERLTDVEMAEPLRASAARVGIVRREMGLPTNSPRRPLTDEERERAGAMLDDDVSYQEVARTIGRDWRAIAAHFPGRGWDVKAAGSYGKLMAEMGRLLEPKTIVA